MTRPSGEEERPGPWRTPPLPGRGPSISPYPERGWVPTETGPFVCPPSPAAATPFIQRERNGQVAVPDGHPRGSQDWKTSEGPQEREMHASVCVCVCVCLSVSQWIAERQSQSTAAPARGQILRPEPRGRRRWDAPARTWVPPPLRNHPLRPATLSRAPSLPLRLISLRSVLV